MAAEEGIYDSSFVVKTTQWDEWVEKAVSTLESKGLIHNLLPIQLPTEVDQTNDDEIHEEFDGLQKWDRALVEYNIADSTFQGLNCGNFYSFSDNNDQTDNEVQPSKKLIVFSSNDYLALSSHPAVAKAAAKATFQHGMGLRGSPLMCCYDNYHRQLETCLAELANKEDSLLCPTGFAANMAVMSALGCIGAFSSNGKMVPECGKVAIFFDALNDAPIIDGIRLVDPQGSVKTFIYKHSDVEHLNELISSCPVKKKVVVTDSVFSMNGDIAPLVELAKLRKKHGFLLVIDEAHATFICGKNGGGIAEELGCAKDVDIYVSTLSKAGGCQGGFVACSKKWKLLIQSTGRAVMISTSLPVPVTAGALAAINVAKKETWRRTAIGDRIREFEVLTGIPCQSHLIVLVVGNEEKLLQMSRFLLAKGFLTVAIKPPFVPSHLCRLRISLSAGHTSEDIKNLASAILEWKALEKGDIY